MKRPMPSRGMISGEMSWAFVGLCFAIYGTGIPPLGSGWFYQKLVEHSSPELWSILIGAPALALFVLGARELIAHRRCVGDAATCWATASLEASAHWRGRMCLAAMLGWLYMLKVLVHDLDRASVLVLVAAGGSAFMWWFYKENRRVRREIRKHSAACRVPATG